MISCIRDTRAPTLRFRMHRKRLTVHVLAEIGEGFGGAVKNCSVVCVKRRTLLTDARRGERLYNKS